jgi:hypothetical protein
MELQRNFLRNRQEAARRQRSTRELKIVIHFPEGMDDSHRARLTEIAKVVERPEVAAMAIDIGLIRQAQWPGGTDSLCHHPFSYYYYSSPYLADFGITKSQIQQIAGMLSVANEPLVAQVREKAMQRQALLDSGVRSDSPAVVQLGSDSLHLQQQINSRPPRDLVMSVLNSDQKRKLGEFEKELSLAREAVELGLTSPRTCTP